MSQMRVISVRENPEYAPLAMEYIAGCWPEVEPVIYHNCITHSLTADGPLPQWYLLLDGDMPIGCAGLITNDFISRMDLWPWLCALYVDEAHRGRGFAGALMRRAMDDCGRAGYAKMYLCTDITGFYERYGFHYMGQGYHPWGEESRIYGITVA